MTARALIIGHGAIGSVFGCALAEAGVDIDVLAAPSKGNENHQRRLVCSEFAPRTYSYRTVSGALNAAGYEIVVVSVKTTALPSVAQAVIEAAGASGTVISAMNGVPWWFAEGASQQPLLDRVPLANIVGCVINLAATRLNDVDIELRGGRELVFGNALVDASGQAARISQWLENTWLECRAVPNIRMDIWRKLLNSASVNPVSALCMATCEQVTSDPGTRSLIRQVMQEVANVGNACGLTVDADLEERINWSASFGAFKTSMLQDLEAGRSVEVDALLSSVLRLAQTHGVPTPCLSNLTSLIALRGAMNTLSSAS